MIVYVAGTVSGCVRALQVIAGGTVSDVYAGTVSGCVRALQVIAGGTVSDVYEAGTVSDCECGRYCKRLYMW